MGQLFGKEKKEKGGKEKKEKGGKKAAVSDKDKAVLRLKRSRDRLSKLQKKTDMDAEKLQNQAKDLLQQGRKERALMALKVRKLKLKEVAACDAKIMNVVEMIENIEWESQNVEVLQALEAGTAALDKIHQEMPIEEVERILEDSAESMELQSQISDMLSEGQFTEADEDELEAQLEALGDDEEEEVEETKAESITTKDKTDDLQMPEVPTTPIFPNVPTHEPIVDGVEKSKEESPTDNLIAE